MTKFIDLTGMKFGRWLVLENTGKKRGTSYLWLCKCECGTLKESSSSQLKMTKSCGCYKDDVSRNRYIRHRLEGSVETKRCSRCRNWLSLDAFGRDKGSWDNLNGECRKCVCARRKGEKFWERERQRTKNRRRGDVIFRLKCVLRSRLSHAIKRNAKTAPTLELLGCSPEFLKSHLESMFLPEMSWENHGTYWHIDHKRPCASFDLSDPEQQKRCFHYSNLQPLTAFENMTKGDRI